MIRRSLEILAVVGVLAVQAMPSQAQPFDFTFVRSDGFDGSSCSDIAAACASIARGIETVNPGGTVNVLDSSAHEAFTIDKSLTLISLAGDNIVTFGIGSPLSGIHVNMPSGNDILTVRGVTIDQQGSNVHGITFIGSGTLHLQNCFIRGSGNGHGVNFIPTGASELHISNCVIADNGSGTSGGILIKPTGAGSARVVLDNVTIENNNRGLTIDGRATTGTNTVTLRNSVSSGSATFGLLVRDTGGGATNVMVEGSTFSNNGPAVRSIGANATIRMRNSTVTGNGTGILAQTGAKLISNGGNVVRGNTANGSFTATEAQQ